MPVPEHGQFIGGAAKPVGGPSIEVEDPAAQRVIATVADGGPDDVDRAVGAARAAFGRWAATSPADRAALLRRVAELLEDRREEIAQLVTAELGAPIRISRSVHAQLPITVTSTTADLLASRPFAERLGNSLVVQQPVGVVAAITPWNFPMHQVTSKVIPALAAGASVVLKPSELAPLSALLLAEVLTDAGLPGGVFNVVTGGPAAGRALVDHDDVDLVSFTGSVEVGRAVAAAAARTVKRVTLELGGKSASLVLPDADIPTAVKVSVANAFFNSGQACNAWTRMLVPADELERVNELALAAAAKHAVGDPADDGTRMGPVISDRQRERVREFIRTGLSEGARLLVGGEAPPDGVDRGYFVRPTVFTDVDPGSTIAQEEIFGPVLSIIGYQDEDHAVEIANGTRYGLGGSVWSQDTDRAVRVAQRIRTGQVDVNGAPFNPAAPFGGFKFSGYGRELGVHGMAEYLETQSIQLPAAGG
ncbi:aldehyde dehydrogenase family protein [Saccharopolyspora sp. NPDC002686]|uniref:aldehyde dehydrogenase family protein n=1 Tax=Saccharopolyspora sp. NPDC002686 TaxID=3154541 RepID=UPI0033179F54